MNYDTIDEMICLIAILGRAEVSRQLLNFRAGFSVDFTPEFLDEQTVDRLRHLLLALCLQCRQMPESAGTIPVAA